ncbi:hypothetical protein R6Z07F_012119 [Ovis aries]
MSSVAPWATGARRLREHGDWQGDRELSAGAGVETKLEKEAGISSGLAHVRSKAPRLTVLTQHKSALSGIHVKNSTDNKAAIGPAALPQAAQEPGSSSFCQLSAAKPRLQETATWRLPIVGTHTPQLRGPSRLSLAALSSWSFCDPHLSHRPPPGGREQPPDFPWGPTLPTTSIIILGSMRRLL